MRVWAHEHAATTIHSGGTCLRYSFDRVGTRDQEDTTNGSQHQQQRGTRNFDDTRRSTACVSVVAFGGLNWALDDAAGPVLRLEPTQESPTSRCHS